jgi:hypothetical protein
VLAVGFCNYASSSNANAAFSDRACEVTRRPGEQAPDTLVKVVTTQDVRAGTELRINYDAGNKTGQPYRDQLICQGATAAQLDDDSYLHTRWQHPSFPRPTEPGADSAHGTCPEDDSFNRRTVGDVSDDGCTRGAGPAEGEGGRGLGGQKRKSKEQWQLEAEQEKWARKEGAIIAPSRTGEGYSLPAGNQLTCKADALFNGLVALGVADPSLPRIRSLSIPELGLNPMASWLSLTTALTTLGYPAKLEEATARFRTTGGPLLNLLKASRGVYLVSLLVTVDNTANRHCIMLSTLSEPHAPHGKLIDNHGRMRPVYLQQKDTRGKLAAKSAWKLFIGQNPALRTRSSFALDLIAVYELLRL